jgi:hypothetical protein
MLWFLMNFETLYYVCLKYLKLQDTLNNNTVSDFQYSETLLNSCLVHN